MENPQWRRWALLLRAAAERGVAPEMPPADGFVDEAGNRRAVDGPFIAWRRKEPKGMPAVSGSEPPEVRLWRAVLDPAIGIEVSSRGPLIPRDADTALELWTESELSSLHALTWVSHRRGDVELTGRCIEAAAWHVEHVQPDNATGHPWAIHLFAMLGSSPTITGVSTSNDAMRLHAEMLLHACQVNLGKPDALSRLILADAADAIDQFWPARWTIAR